MTLIFHIPWNRRVVLVGKTMIVHSPPETYKISKQVSYETKHDPYKKAFFPVWQHHSMDGC